MPNTSTQNVKVGPGLLYIAPIGSTEPTDLTTAWNASWVLLGFTSEGHTFTQSPSWEGIEVAESKVPIKYYQGSIEYTVEFSCAEMTAKNLQRAFNGGTITTSGTGTAQIDTFEPPAATDVATRLMIGWQSDAADERWVYRQCVMSGDSEIGRAKGPDYATIPMSFNLEQPGSAKPFKAIISNPV